MIEVHQLTKQFRIAGGRVITAVGGVSFVVGAGEVYGLLGPNGAGKTTTLRMILGLLEPTSGYAAIGGYLSSEHPREVKRQVGIVSAGTGTYQWQTVRQMLVYFGDLYALPAERIRSRVDELSQQLGFRDLLDRRCVSLSTGERQRVNLGRALIHDPVVMLLDEPTLGLDVLGCRAVHDYVRMLRARGKAVILCTHHLDEAERICDRFGLMHQGNLVAEGTLDELRGRTGQKSLVEMFLQLSGAAPALPLGEVVASSK